MDPGKEQKMSKGIGHDCVDLLRRFDKLPKRFAGRETEVVFTGVGKPAETMFLSANSESCTALVLRYC